MDAEFSFVSPATLPNTRQAELLTHSSSSDDDEAMDDPMFSQLGEKLKDLIANGQQALKTAPPILSADTSDLFTSSTSTIMARRSTLPSSSMWSEPISASEMSKSQSAHAHRFSFDGTGTPSRSRIPTPKRDRLSMQYGSTTSSPTKSAVVEVDESYLRRFGQNGGSETAKPWWEQ